MDDGDLVVAVDRGRDRCRIDVAGDLTAFSCKELSKTAAAELRNGATRLELGLDGVEFLDSSGVQCLVNVQRTATDAGATMTIVAASLRVERVLEITGLAGLLPNPPPA